MLAVFQTVLWTEGGDRVNSDSSRKGRCALPGVLYHPNFEPSLSWLRSSLLVYDNVWSIVPLEADYSPSDNIERHLEKLPDTFATLAPEPLDIRTIVPLACAVPGCCYRSSPDFSPNQVHWGTDSERIVL